MNDRTDTFIVEQSRPSERLDSFLRSRYPAVSRGAFQRLIEQGDVTVNGQRVKSTHSPRAGEELRVHFPAPRSAEAQPEDIPLEVLYEDECLVVVNKAPGYVVHPSSGHEEHTLVNALLHHCRGQLSGIGGIERPGIVHRLDKDTTGCLVVAKTDAAHQALQFQFANRKVDKTYHAILCGELARAEGNIRAAICRHRNQRKKMTVDEDAGRPAWTGYRVMEHLRCATLVSAFLYTGRTHQIRVHFQHLGYPLVGDLTYGQRQNRKLEDLTRFRAERVMLHAQRLVFTHPQTGDKMMFEAPWPQDFWDAVAFLRTGTST